MKILLIGYYGKGNFGDDVLFKVTYGLIRSKYKNAKIFILCDQYKDDYLSKITNENINIVTPGHSGIYDLIVHGGGGTFFDFKNGRVFDRVINFLIKLIGTKNYVRIEKVVRSIVKEKKIKSSKRLGFGIGVGTYTKDSKILKSSLPILMDFESLIVRDKTSIKNLKNIGVNNNIALGSDLAFIQNFWVPKNRLIEKTNTQKKKLGFILRDWSNSKTNLYLDEIIKIAPHLIPKYDIEFFSFDDREDNITKEKFSKFQMTIWNPNLISFDDYCKKIENQDILITARAHGAICGAILGVPCLIINIEPKLETIHRMLPNATKLINIENLKTHRLLEEINFLIQLENQTIKSDVLSNKNIIEKSIKLSLK